jgi:hypothetical protein
MSSPPRARGSGEDMSDTHGVPPLSGAPTDQSFGRRYKKGSSQASSSSYPADPLDAHGQEHPEFQPNFHGEPDIKGGRTGYKTRKVRSIPPQQVAAASDFGRRFEADVDAGRGGR